MQKKNENPRHENLHKTERYRRATENETIKNDIQVRINTKTTLRKQGPVRRDDLRYHGWDSVYPECLAVQKTAR